ncbi:MAG: TetR/AcrR family transcriptional regulator, partial [Polyangiaceae bacterium]
MNAKTERKEQSHERILASASRLLRERGIAGAGVADVMKGARLTVGGFYSHFASKEALIDEALRRTGAEVRARLFEGIEEKPEADRAEVILKRYLSAAHRDELVAGCPLPAVVGEVGTTSVEYRGVLGGQVDAMASAL